MNILFIDDEKKSNEPLVAELIQRYNIQTDWIRDTQTMSEYFDKNYDAVLLDIMIPVDDSFTNLEKKKSTNGLTTGFIILERIRQIWPKIPVLIYSARGDIEKYIVDIKNITFIQKPKVAAEIVEELTTLIKKTK